MSLQFLAFGIAAALIILIEWILWRLFRARSRSFEFPHATDASDLRIFSVRGLRICTFVHAAALMTIAGISFFYLW